MTSIMTNAAAMAALQTLRTINTDMETTQARVSSGLRVGSAGDNAAYWSIATTMRSDNKALSTVKDALGLGAAKVDIAYTAMNSSIDVISEIKAKLVAAREPGVDKTKIDKELTELKNQLQSISESASFSGENWLNNSSTAAAGTKSIVGGFNRDVNGLVTITTLDVSVTSITMIGEKNESLGILTKDIDANALDPDAATTTARNYFLIDTGSTTGTTASGAAITLTAVTTDAEVDDMVRVVDSILSQMTDAASNLGAINKRVSMQEDFVANLMDSIDKGVGRLVDADMNEESTRLKALQTQQQLGIQSLSIANSNSQNILSLFQQ
ncbi:flagellin/flagellar hook associated protein [Hoeflea sp. IMCC20628]|uniref:flagellin N-terminal helical domain-containing protein n=1 Tax=Hoeflea sp. IMCC20628 TaxID=1620421 RepID=UPI00063AD36B|nr:flagellin [Hoeflea sp. IMCC20628]AKI02147.1 flagellin/flagellar hook associated protein [Hoeflea sp. IMCC20628]